MKTYPALIRWMIARGLTEELRLIIVESMGSIPNERYDAQWLRIFLVHITEYLHSGMMEKEGRNLGAVGNLKPFYDVWLRLECPGLCDQVVTTRLKEWGLFDEFKNAS